MRPSHRADRFAPGGTPGQNQHKSGCAAARSKSGFAIAVSVAVLISLLPGVSCSGRREETRVLRLAHGLDPTHPVHKAMLFLAERAAADSGGRLRIEVYPSEQLGSEREALELLQIGSLDMTKVSVGVLEGFVPVMGVLGLPYLFADEAHLWRVLDGDIGARLLRAGEPFRFRGLCFYDAGSRSFYTKGRPILAPGDLAGLKIRTQQSPTAMRMVEVMGGSPTPIAWGELYSALQQGVVDGAENNPPSFFLSRHYEVCQYYSLDEHTAVPDILLVGLRTWTALPSDLRTVLERAARASEAVQKELWKAAVVEALAGVEAAGVEVLRPDRGPFAALAGPLRAELVSQPELAVLIREIEEAR